MDLELRTQVLELRTQALELRTQALELRTQPSNSSSLRARVDSEVQTLELRAQPSSSSSLRTRVDSEVQYDWDKDDVPPVPPLPPAIIKINKAVDALNTFPDGLDSLDAKINEDKLEKGHKGDPWLVTFTPNDPENPKNWGRVYRWFLTALSGIYVLNSTFASSSPSGIIEPTIEHFGMSEEVAVLTISLFVLGYTIGPILWGPLSEQYGRKPIFIIAFVVYTAFQVGCALAPNTASILIFRFLGGTFAASPMTNSGAVMADIWDVKTRGKAMTLFCLAPFAGPALGPIVAGYIATSGASWRWLYWTLTAFAGGCLITMLFLPETYEPIILVKKARRLRKETKDERFYAAYERRPKRTFVQLVQQLLVKPFALIIAEPMLLAVSTYMAFIYGCMYLEFEAYPIVFTIGHGMSAGSTGLMFLPVLIGAVLGVFLIVLIFEPRYIRQIEKLKPKPVPPEERLSPAMWMGVPYVISFFWFAWTSFPSITYWVPMLSGLFMGIGFFMIFIGLINYTVDAYLPVAASALAIQTILRSLAGAGFPLFANQMYTKLNPRWATSLLGFLALGLMPIPLLLHRFGPRLRKRSKYAPL